MRAAWIAVQEAAEFVCEVINDVSQSANAAAAEASHLANTVHVHVSTASAARNHRTSQSFAVRASNVSIDPNHNNIHIEFDEDSGVLDIFSSQISEDQTHSAPSGDLSTSQPEPTAPPAYSVFQDDGQMTSVRSEGDIVLVDLYPTVDPAQSVSSEETPLLRNISSDADQQA
eukprot:jgi/Hompol1/1733/HPOL_005702-RA